jgi:hypothetical protein
MTKDSIDHLENAYTLLASIVQANPTAGNEAVGAVRSGLLTDKNDKVSVQMALISFVDIRMTQRQADERFETMHFSNTADNDKFLQELYAHGQVDRAEDVGPMLTDERCYKRSKDYLSEDILKKYGSSAYRFLQDNMQTRAYPGDEGNAQQYLDTLKAALAEKAPEELIQYVSTYSDMKNLSEEQKKQFVEEDQRMYKNWSEGHWVSDEQNADENLKQEWFRMEIMARRALSKASSAETNAAPADEQSAQKETINKAEKGQTSNLSPEAMKKISEAKTQRH